MFLAIIKVDKSVTSMTSRDDLDMGLDLLVARASMDPELRQELLNNAEIACLENGLQLPKGTKIIFTDSASSVIVKEIPVVESASTSIKKTQTINKELAQMAKFLPNLMHDLCPECRYWERKPGQQRKCSYRM